MLISDVGGLPEVPLVGEDLPQAPQNMRQAGCRPLVLRGREQAGGGPHPRLRLAQELARSCADSPVSCPPVLSQRRR
jgi:hypothetical protein